MTQNCSCLQEQIIELRLESEYLQSFLPRTEMALKQRLNQKGLRLLHVDGQDEYRSTLDWLLAITSAEWDAHIRAYYRTGTEKLGDVAEWGEILEIDRVLRGVVKELRRTHSALVREGWVRGDPPFDVCPEVTLRVREGVRALAGPLLPVPEDVACAA